MPEKPLNGKAYGSIPHLPGSRMGPGDHHCAGGQYTICCEKVRDKYDRITVQEKYDGSCCSVAKIGGAIVPLIRAGYRADTSHYEQHHLFAAWVYERQDLFDRFLHDGERVVGEWLAQAHGTRYTLNDGVCQPFIIFDLIRDNKRATTDELYDRAEDFDVALPWRLHVGGPFSIEKVISSFEKFGSSIGALDPVEGAVWRVERLNPKTGNYTVDFLAKWVRPDKVDGLYLPEVSGSNAIWNWRPK